MKKLKILFFVNAFGLLVSFIGCISSTVQLSAIYNGQPGNYPPTIFLVLWALISGFVFCVTNFYVSHYAAEIDKQIDFEKLFQLGIELKIAQQTLETAVNLLK